MFWNRKKLIFMLIICLIFVFICMYKDNDSEKHGTIQTSGTPVSNHTVILDAGHGQPDRSGQFLQMEFKKKKSIFQLF